VSCCNIQCNDVFSCTTDITRISRLWSYAWLLYYRYEVSRNRRDEMNVIESLIIYMRDYNYTLSYKSCKLIAIQNSDRRVQELRVQESYLSSTNVKTNTNVTRPRNSFLLCDCLTSALVLSSLRYIKDFLNIQWRRKETKIINLLYINI